MKIVLILIITLIALYVFRTGFSYRDLLLYYGILAVIPIIFVYLKKNLLNALLIWFFFVLFRYGFPNYGSGIIPLPGLPDIYPERIIWLAIFFVFSLEFFWGERKLFNISKVEIVMLCFCLYVLISKLITGNLYVKGQGLAMSIFLSAYAVPFSIFFIAKNIIDDEQKIRKVFIFFSIIGAYLGLTGIFEHFLLQDFIFPRYIGVPWQGIHYGQARGPFLQAGVNGMVLAVIFILTGYLFLHKNKKRSLFPLGVSLILMLAGLLLTQNRASWLGAILAQLIIIIFIPKARKILVVIIIAVALFGILINIDIIDTKKLVTRTKTTSSVYGRINLYITAWRMFIEKPIFGFGWKTFQEENYKYLRAVKGIPFRGTITEQESLHDTWVKILVELGLVGFSMFAFIIVSIFTASIRLYRILPQQGFCSKQLIIIFWGIGIVFLMRYQISDLNYFMFPNGLFFMIAGIVYGLYQRELRLESGLIPKNLISS